jgi:integrase
VRGRIEVVLDWARARGYRQGENPARWKGHLDHLLPAKSKLHRVEHFAALSYAEIGPFMAELRERPETAARALEFLILVAARTAEVRFAQWSEIKADVWTIPAERMKSNREHRATVVGRAAELLAEMPRTSEFVFTASGGAPLATNSLANLVHRMGRSVTIHGFRASFKTWASECTGYPRDVVEMALAHSIGTGVEAAYRRGDLFEKRKRLMAEWGAFCGTSVGREGEVVALRAVS